MPRIKVDLNWDGKVFKEKWPPSDLRAELREIMPARGCLFFVMMGRDFPPEYNELSNCRRGKESKENRMRLYDLSRPATIGR